MNDWKSFEQVLISFTQPDHNSRITAEKVINDCSNDPNRFLVLLIQVLSLSKRAEVDM
jgi:hypothetical protein